MDATGSFEMLVPTNKSTHHHIPEDNNPDFKLIK
jgi:hypothetical protein